jgi:hypothetical protein
LFIPTTSASFMNLRLLRIHSSFGVTHGHSGCSAMPFIDGSAPTRFPDLNGEYLFLCGRDSASFSRLRTRAEIEAETQDGQEYLPHRLPFEANGMAKTAAAKGGYGPYRTGVEIDIQADRPHWPHSLSNKVNNETIIDIVCW